MITKHEIGPISNQINNNFSMLQSASFSMLTTLLSLMLTMKIKERVNVECTPINISQQKLTQRWQDTILNAREKLLIELKNSFDVSLCSTIFFQVVMPIFKMQNDSLKGHSQ